jgi:serine/threonine protein kinase/WD40 repeat protein
MGTVDPEPHPFEEVAASFLESFRRGENPELSLYQEEHPELAEEIRDLFPALLILEDLGSLVGDGTAGGGPALPQPSERLGEYRVIREIGRGGMGVVYEAEQESLGRRVALKVLLFHSFADSSRLERFHREARAAAGLRHQNIVPVHAIGEHQGLHYFAMEFIRGRNLQEILKEMRQAPDGQALAGALAPAGGNGSRFHAGARAALQVAEALAYAHAQGVLHRDIKPSNLLLDSGGTVWLTDFGLAKSDEAEALTHQGDWIGTLRYMPAERFKGWSDPRSDVYSLGVTLYEILTLEPAFPEEDRARLIQQVTSVSVPRPRKASPGIPRDLETIVLKATEKEPGHRYQSAEAMAADLRCFLSDRPISARRSTTLERSWRWCRRNRALASLICSVALLLLVIAIGSSVTALRLTDSLEKVRAANLEGKENLWRSYLAQARASRWSRRAGQRFESMAAVTKAAAIRSGPELRDEAVASMALVDLREKRRLELGSSGYAAFDADLERYAACDGKGRISVRSLVENREIARVPGSSHPVWRIEFSSGGRYLASRSHEPSKSDAVCQVWEVGGQTPVLSLPVGDPSGAMAFSPDGQEVAVGFASGSLSTFRLPGGESSKTYPVGPGPFSAAFHPREPILAVSSSVTGKVQLLDLRSGGAIRVLPHRDAAWGIAWHPRGKLLAVASGQGIHLWDTTTGLKSVLLGHQGPVIDICFSHAGDLLASRSYDGTTRLWDPYSVQELVVAPGVYQQPRFSWDDRLLAAYELGPGALGIWEVAAGRGWQALRCAPGEGGYFEVDFSPDDRLLAAGGRDGVKLWDLATGSEVGTVPQRDCRSVFFHPQSGDLITSGCFGLRRWALSKSKEGVVRIGPPRKLYQPSPSESPSCRVSRDGRILAFVAGDSIVVLLEEGAPERKLEGHDRVAYLDFSPDGRYFATGTWKGDGVRVWSAAEAKLLRELPVGESATVAFSADGRWLVTGSVREFRFFETGSWQPGRAFPRDERSRGPGPLCFDGDGGMLVVAGSLFGLELLDPATGRKLSLLEAPNLDVITSLRFSHDGGRLAVLVHDRVHLWDLRRVRDGLRPLGLDWNLPAFTPREEREQAETLRLQLAGDGE